MKKQRETFQKRIVRKVTVYRGLERRRRFLTTADLRLRAVTNRGKP